MHMHTHTHIPHFTEKSLRSKWTKIQCNLHPNTNDILYRTRKNNSKIQITPNTQRKTEQTTIVELPQYLM